MRSSWVQPSLSRDFALLSAAILFILCLISAWVSYTTYVTHHERVASDLDKESLRIEHTLADEMEEANYMLGALGHQIVLEPTHDTIRLAQILKSFANKDNIFTIFSWVDPQQRVVVSSSKGILDTPVDVSDRDYEKKSLADPWKMAIGRPIEGRVSAHWVIPVAMGLTDYTGKFIGTIMISIDINLLTEKISGLVKRDGLSFAVVSKTMIPLAQVSDDKDFVRNNFPMQKLVNVNFTTNPSGMVSQGNLLFGTGSYTAYRVSQVYPYVILLGYDAHYSDEAVRSLLWSRLLQMIVMAMFFFLFLWLVKVRMIKPVLDMTLITAAVARGEPYTPLPQGGPVEIEALATQVRRVGEYIEESKRIEDEMRNKMFMLRKAREYADMAKRSHSEFLAYICQEMHAPLNNIIGAAQVMKDQLYGPIENRKYRQYATDIFSTGNVLLEEVQDLQTLARASTDYIELSEKQVEIATVINKAVRMVADRLQAENLAVRVKLPDPPPLLIADEFRLQQILMNLLLYTLEHTLPESAILLEAKTVSENRDRMFFAFILTTQDSSPAVAELVAAAEKLLPLSYHATARMSGGPDEEADLRLELAKTLVAMHHGAIDIRQSHDSGITIVVLLPGGRIRFTEES